MRLAQQLIAAAAAGAVCAAAAARPAAAAAAASGPQLSLYPCNATAPPVNTAWGFSGDASTPGAFSLRGTAQCVTYDPPSTNLVVSDCGAAGEPLQTFVPRADGTIFSPSTGLCWDSQYYGNATGSVLGLYACAAPQEWGLFRFSPATGQITNEQNGNVLCVNGGGPPPPLPTAQQLAWMEHEVALMISYDLVTQLTEVPNPQHFCIQAGGDSGFAVPPPTRFDPSNATFTDSWMAAARAANAGYTLLVASHCSGFLQWQSNVTLPDGSPYPYTVAQSHWKGGAGDVVADYVASSNAAGLGYGFYLTVRARGGALGEAERGSCTRARSTGELHASMLYRGALPGSCMRACSTPAGALHASPPPPTDKLLTPAPIPPGPRPPPVL